MTWQAACQICTKLYIYIEYINDIQGMYIVYMAGRPPRQKAKNDARQQLCSDLHVSFDNLDALVAKNPSGLSRIWVKEGYFSRISKIRRPKIVRVIEGLTYRGTPVIQNIPFPHMPGILPPLVHSKPGMKYTLYSIVASSIGRENLLYHVNPES